MVDRKIKENDLLEMLQNLIIEYYCQKDLDITNNKVKHRYINNAIEHFADYNKYKTGFASGSHEKIFGGEIDEKEYPAAMLDTIKHLESHVGKLKCYNAFSRLFHLICVSSIDNPRINQLKPEFLEICIKRYVLGSSL